MEAALHDLLTRTKDTKNTTNTHVSYIPRQQFLNIRRDRLDEFWEGYCQLVYKGGGNYSVAEINQQDMPVVSVMNFRFNQEDSGQEEIFGDQFILELVHVWQEAIKKILQISDSQRELIAVLLESEREWIQGNQSNFQVRIQFPYCKTDADLITKIRTQVICLLRRRNTLRLLDVTPENDWEEILDPKSHLSPLLLYKSTQVAGRPKMTLSNVYDVVTLEHLETQTAPLFNLADAFNPLDHSQVLQGIISRDIFEPTDQVPDKEDVIFWLPLILSIHYANTITLAKIFEEKPVSSREISSEYDNNWSQLDKAKFFLAFLSQERVTDYFFWKDLGRALYSASGGSEEGLNTWIDFTLQNDSFSEEDCRNHYPNFESEQQITYKTLAWYAKEDSPDDYRIWHDDWCQEALEKALSCQDAPVAEYIYRKYWLEIACVNPDKMDWYSFNGVRWKSEHKSYVLADRINREIIPTLENYRIQLSQSVHSLTNPVEKQPQEAKIKSICELINKLNNQRFVSTITKAAAVPFHREYQNFGEYINTNADLMGHIDCVTEANEDGITIRSGKPEDYISMSSNQRLNKNFSWQHPRVVEVMEWLRKIHVNSQLRHEFLKECASWLRGGNNEKRVPIYTGESDNSKSMFIRCAELAFGQYFGKFPTTVFTGKRTQSSSATPEIARTRGKRVMISQETDEDVETFRKGVIKELSGNDSIYSRALHDNGGEFTPMFKLIFVCNKIPRFIGNDPAIKNRIRIIPFLSKWTDSAPDEPEEQYKIRQFKKDPNFEKRLPYLAPALLWILVQYYPKYIREHLCEPAIVREHTEKYWQKQDYYHQYIQECLEFHWLDEQHQQPDNKVTLFHPELYRHFKNWLNQSMPGIKTPDTTDVKDAFERRLTFDGKKYLGVSIIRNQEDR